MAQSPQTDWVNFAQLKEKISFPQLLAHFDLANRLSQGEEELRGPCPICGNEGFKVNLVKNTFSCPSCKKRGSVIDFVSAYRKVGLKEAGQLLKELLETLATPQVKETSAPRRLRRRNGKAKPSPAPSLTQTLNEEVIATAQALDTKLKEVQALSVELMAKLGRKA